MQNLLLLVATDLTVVVSKTQGAQVPKYLNIGTYVLPERQGNISFFFSKWESRSLSQLNIFLSTV